MWNEYIIKTLAEQVNSIDSSANLDILLMIVGRKLCDFAPRKDTCQGCHYKHFCRDLYDFNSKFAHCLDDNRCEEIILQNGDGGKVDEQ